MTNEESAKVVKEWLEAEKAYQNYINQFMTTTINGDITHKAIKVMTDEDGKQIDKLRAMADEKRKHTAVGI